MLKFKLPAAAAEDDVDDDEGGVVCSSFISGCGGGAGYFAWIEKVGKYTRLLTSLSSKRDRKDRG